MTNITCRRKIFSEDDLKKRITELGAQITKDYEGEPLVLVGVLKGSLYFFADLSRAIDAPIEIDMMAIGSIPDTTSQTGIVRITKDLDVDIRGKHVLVIEDVIRTGLTTAYLLQSLEVRKPLSIDVCTLLYNPDRQLINVPIKYYGFEIDKNWLIGYGMDIEEKGRNLPFIGEYEKKN
ncbi:MAG TPA: hypoxanthine phosphoribosyltransferase [Bacillota bacterium]|nr:hypoxanthine phosphoribosyltransferase [Bacillota bacterium]